MMRYTLPPVLILARQAYETGSLVYIVLTSWIGCTEGRAWNGTQDGLSFS